MSTALTRYTHVPAGLYEGRYYVDAHMEPHADGEWVKHADLYTEGGLLREVEKVLDYAVHMAGPLFVRGDQIETYEGRCQYFSDCAAKFLATIREGRTG